MRIIVTLIALVAHVAARADLPPVVVEFETRVSTGKDKTKQVWKFDRKDKQVVHSFSDVSRRWTLFSSSEIALEQIYPAEKMVIELNQGDLKAVGGSTDWAPIAHLVDTNLLAKLTPKSARKMHGKQAVRYTGVVQNATWDIVWIPELQLPAVIRRKDKTGEMKTQMTRVLSASKEAPDAGFTRIDFADVGDMENNEQLQRVLRHDSQMPHRH